ncbi:MAG: CpaF family protein [Acidimicrobiia bacterium]|nr:CpaF family protein [Acidimicrobiia bacterium]
MTTAETHAIRSTGGADRVAQVAAVVHRRVVETAAGVGDDPLPAPSRAAVVELARQVDPLLAPSAVTAVADTVLARTTGVGPLQPFLADEEVAEVMVNGDGSVWLERGGRLERTPLRLETDEVMGIIERVTAPLGRRVDRHRPTVDARLPDGSRVHAVVPPVAVDGPSLTIRRFRVRRVRLRSFCDTEVATLLERFVRRRANMVVSGGTGAGKTTLLNALAAVIGEDERVVTVEDTAELRLPGAHVVRLEARPAGPEGEDGIPLGELVRTALRMRPDRIVVGETRGPEALAVLAAMNTGHEGSLSTLHANSAPDALRRLETMVLSASSGLPLPAVREHIAAAVDVIVQVSRSAGRRTITSVEEVEDVGEGRVSTRPLVRGGEVVADPIRPRLRRPS